MPEESSLTISFDVLLHGKTDDVSVAAADVDKLRPSPQAIETCHRWLSQQGVTCHRTDFGLACEADVELFEALFKVRVVKHQASPAAAAVYLMDDEPQPPQEIKELVSQVTVAQPPTYFGKG